MMDCQMDFFEMYHDTCFVKKPILNSICKSLNFNTNPELFLRCGELFNLFKNYKSFYFDIHKKNIDLKSKQLGTL